MLTLESVSYKNRFTPLFVPIRVSIVLTHPRFEYLNALEISQDKSMFLKHLKFCPYVTIAVVKDSVYYLIGEVNVVDRDSAFPTLLV
jgi:hypothetical protein